MTTTDESTAAGTAEAGTDRARPVLIRALQAAFPHANVPRGPYERTADKLLADAEGSPWSRAILHQGLADLDVLAGGDFVGLSNAEGHTLLKRIETTDFFGYLRRFTVVALYDDAELWDALGYEGASFDRGGYLHRGFNDLDWLPEPRITRYEGPVKFVPIADKGLLRLGGRADAGGNLDSTLSTQHDPQRNAVPGKTSTQTGV